MYDTKIALQLLFPIELNLLIPNLIQPMNLSTLIKKRKAISPLIATLLMFALIMLSIGISLIYMWPSLESFKGNSYNNSSRLYFTSIDSVVKDLSYQRPPAVKKLTFTQQEGRLYVDDSWELFFYLKDQNDALIQMPFTEKITRLMHRSAYTADYQKGEHRYLIGPSNQDYLFLNGSPTLYNDITVLNESRGIFGESTNFLYLALYYRYFLNIDYQQEGNTEIYQIGITTIDLIYNTSSNYVPEQTSINVQINYLGTEKTQLEDVYFNEAIQGETQLVDEYGSIHIENPFYFPANSQFTTHLLKMNLIKVQMELTFS